VRSSPSRGWAVAAAALLFVWPIPIRAQDADPHAAQPERPTVSTHAGTVAPGWVEVEAGFEADGYPDHAHGDLGPLTVKVGLAPRLQLTIQESIVRAPGTDTTGFGDLGAGIKWRLIEHAPIVGDVAVLPAIKMPFGSVAHGDGTGTTDGSLLLISSHEFGSVSLDVNLGYTHRSGDGSVVARNAGVWAAAAAGPVLGRLGWTSEVFEYLATSAEAGTPRIIGVIEGATFQVRKWLVVDAGIAAPVTGPQPHAAFVGVVYNVGQIRKRI
jgi:hypothetical protein